MTVQAPPATITVTANHRPGSHPTHSNEFVKWWLPILGPTSTLLATLLADELSRDDPAIIDVDELAARLGNLAARTLATAIRRLDMFGLARVMPDGTMVLRLSAPQLDARHLRKLPSSMADAYMRGDW